MPKHRAANIKANASGFLFGKGNMMTTISELRKYLTDEKIDREILLILRELCPPLGYDRKEEGKVFIYTIRRNDKILGQLSLDPESLELGYHFKGAREEAESFNEEYAKIVDHLEFMLRACKESGTATLAAQAQGVTLGKPGKSEPLDKWFAYYTDCRKHRIRYTLADLAKELNHSAGYIRQEHAKYQAEHAEQNT